MELYSKFRCISVPLSAGDMELSVAHKLYNRGLVYLDVPVSDDDCIALPPLDGTFFKGETFFFYSLNSCACSSDSFLKTSHDFITASIGSILYVVKSHLSGLFCTASLFPLLLPSPLFPPSSLPFLSSFPPLLVLTA